MIHQFEPQIDFRCIWAVVRQLLRKEIGVRSETTKFEQNLCKLTGRKYCVATNSGTSALLLSVWALDLPRGSNIMFPAYTMVAGANAILIAGHNVTLVDIDEHELAMVIPNDKGFPDAVLYVDHNGLQSGLKNIKGIPMIEDACQSIGIPGAATSGSMSTLSFSVPKLVTTGQGGAILTDNRELYEDARKLSHQGYPDGIGGNFRLNDIAATIGNRQLAMLPLFVRRRKRIIEWYNKHLILSPPWVTNCWCPLYRSSKANRVLFALNGEGIQATMPYRPIYESLGLESDDFPNARIAADELIYLPISLSLKERHVKRIASIIKRAEG